MLEAANSNPNPNPNPNLVRVERRGVMLEADGERAWLGLAFGLG